MSQWHYTQNGQKSGPIDQDLLQCLISSGHVGPADTAWKAGMTGWRAISTLPELIAQSAAQPAGALYGQGGHSGAVNRPDYGAGKAALVDYYTPQAPLAGRAPAAPVAGDYAGFWIRVVAYVIDQLIIAVPAVFVICFIFGTDALKPNNPYMTEMKPYIDIGFIVASWLYYALQESSPRQATFGKRMLGLRVADMDGQQIGFVRASARYFGKILSGLICSIGYMMAGFTEKKQGLHDMIAGTFVVTTWR
jgi:uncharacterized RDD family membrane protein YckC